VADDAERKRGQLRDSVRLIVASRERTPRNPRWSLAWRRTLFRYIGQLQLLEKERLETNDASEGKR